MLSGKTCPPARYAALRKLAHGGLPIDTALVLYFEAPASFTGEDMAEFQVHGGGAVIRSLERALEQLGARRADPGEFSRRAFHNGRIDLTGAEALADLIAAESEAQQAQALAQAAGALETLYAGWSKRLTRALAYVEASLDFADEDLPPDILDATRADIAALAGEVGLHLADARRGERLRNGFRVAIIGAPNVGKSSLLNALAQREAAIVSQTAGTTRDVIEVHLNLGGYPVILSDTAGLRDTHDHIEAEGIARAKATAEAADIKLILFEAMAPPPEEMAVADDTIIVLTKADTGSLHNDREASFIISVVTGRGMPKFLQHLTSRIAALCGDLSRPAPTRERHRSQLIHTMDALDRFALSPSADLAAEDLRIALRAIGRITGRVDVEDLLDVIFREFCIGK